MPKTSRPPDPLPDIRSSGTVEEALHWFRQDLEMAAKIFQEDRELGKHAAIKAVISFLYDMEVETGHLRKPFSAIAEELEERLHPTRPSILRLKQKACIAAAVDVLMQVFGETEKHAARLVVAEMRRAKITIGHERSETQPWQSAKELRSSLLKAKEGRRDRKLFDHRRGEWANVLAKVLRDIETLGASEGGDEAVEAHKLNLRSEFLKWVDRELVRLEDELARKGK